MCGRFTLNMTLEELENYVANKYNINQKLNFNLPQYNIAPSTNIISVIHDGKNYRIGELKWGFIPSFKTEDNFNLINVKSETVFEKPMFRNAVLNQRCIVLANSFYEWNSFDKKDYPRRIYLKDRPIFSMAAIWNTATDKEGNKVHTVALLTTSANSLIAKIHNRMPVILDEKLEQLWLDRTIKSKQMLEELFLPYEADLMDMYKVSKNINKPSYNEKDSIDEVVVNEEATLV